MIRKLFSDERGSSIIIFTLGITVFFGFLAFVVDAGFLYFNKAKVAGAVDATALAGAQELPYQPMSAVGKARDYAAANSLDPNSLKIVINETKTKIRISSKRDVNLLFAKVLGINTGEVGHTAVAQVAPIVGVGGAAPLGVHKQDFIFGQQYTLKVGSGDTDGFTTSISGWFGALSLGASGSNKYEENLTYGFSGHVMVGDIIPVETGNMSNPTKRAIDYRITEDKHTPYCTIDHFERDCTRLLRVPVIEIYDKHNVKVVGFAMFLVDESVMGQGNNNYIKGKFVKSIVSGDIDPNSTDYGLKGVKLIQ